MIISRSRVLWHRDRNSRRTLHQKLPTGSTQQSKDQHQDTHRQHSRQVHGNKTRSIKESKTHRTEIHVHPTIGARRHHQHTQGIINGQLGRHPDHVHNQRSSTLASLRCWYQPTLTNNKQQHQNKQEYHQYVCKTYITNSSLMAIAMETHTHSGSHRVSHRELRLLQEVQDQGIIMKHHMYMVLSPCVYLVHPV